MRANAVHSLYGGATARALAGNVGGQKREQVVCTPEWILDAAREALGGCIALDPCGAPANSAVVTHKKRPSVEVHGCWFADVTLVGESGHEEALRAPHGGSVHSMDGLTAPWHKAAGTFANPPFGQLSLWLAKAQDEAAAGAHVVLLCPVRTHRKWWIASTQGAEIVLLDYDVRFRGHRYPFPAPLCLATWNCRLPDLGNRETGRWRP